MLERQKCEPDKTFLGTEVQQSVEPKAAWIRFRSCCRDRSGSFEVPQKSRSRSMALVCASPRGGCTYCCYKTFIGAIASAGSFVRIQSASMRADLKQNCEGKALKSPPVPAGGLWLYRLSQHTFFLLAIDHSRTRYRCQTFSMAVLKRVLSSHKPSQSRRPSPRLGFKSALASCRRIGLTNSLRLSYQCSKRMVCCKRNEARNLHFRQDSRFSR